MAFTPVVDNSNSTATPDNNQGYNFDGNAADQTFNISHNGNVIGNTGGISFDRNPAGLGVATLNFEGSATVSGSIGNTGSAPTRSINILNLNTNNQPNAQIIIQTGDILAGAINFTQDALLRLDSDLQTITSNIATNLENTGSIQFTEGGATIGAIGLATPLKALNFLNQSGNKTLTLNNTVQVYDVSLGGNDGTVLVKDNLSAKAQMQFTGNNSLLQFEDGKNGTATNGVITQTDQQGKIDFLGTSTFTGNLGEKLKSLARVSGGAAAAKTLTLQGADTIYVKNMILSGDGTLLLNANNANMAVYAAIDSEVNNNQGEVKVLSNNNNIVHFKNPAGQTHALRLLTISGNTEIEADFLVQNTQISNAKTLTIYSKQKINSLIDGDQPLGSAGTLIFKDSNTTYADIGSVKKLQEVHFTGLSGSVFELQHNIKALTTRLQNNEILAIAQNLLNPVQINGNLNLEDQSQLTVPYGQTLALTGTGNLLLSNQTALNYQMNHSVKGLAPALTSTGKATLEPASQINLINPPVVAAIPIGQTRIVLIQDNSGAAPAIPILNFAENSLLLSTKLSAETNSLNLVFNRKAMAELNPQAHWVGVGEIFDDIAGQPNVSGELLSLIQQLDGFSKLNLNGFRADLSSVTPIIDSASTQMAQTTQQDVFGLFTQRIDDLRAYYQFKPSDPSNPSGYNAGFLNQRKRATWLKLFANYREQDAHDFINGFEGATTGIALGADYLLTDSSLLGVGLAYANSNIHHDLNQAKTTLNYYQASLYGGVNLSNPWFVNWMAAATYLEYEQNRRLKFNQINLPIQASYPGWQYGARAEAGYAFGKLSFHTIPLFALSYSYLSTKAYTETGAGTANQHVSAATQHNLQAEFGVKLANNWVIEDRLTQPEVHATVRYDIVAPKQSISSQFIGAGPVYQTIGYQPTRESYNIGVSFTLFGEGAYIFSVSYDYDFKNNYRAHSGFIRLRYEW